jgi:hypothetical protein
VLERFARRFGREPRWFVTGACDGARVVAPR